jgi:hypothetical protein
VPASRALLEEVTVFQKLVLQLLATSICLASMSLSQPGCKVCFTSDRKWGDPRPQGECKFTYSTALL